MDIPWQPVGLLALIQEPNARPQASAGTPVPPLALGMAGSPDAALVVGRCACIIEPPLGRGLKRCAGIFFRTDLIRTGVADLSDPKSCCTIEDHTVV